MDCRRVEAHFEEWLDGDLPAAVAHEIEAHARDCPDCLELLGLGSASAGIAVEAEDLATAVLARTSGSVCGSAERRFGRWLDGALDGGEAALVAAHVDGCSDCRELVAVLERLPAELAAMSVVQPPDGFVDAVLARTLPLGVRLRRTAARARRRWVRRPRFAIELAYVATALATVFIGLPARGLGDPIAAVGERPAEVFEAVRQGAEVTVDGAQEALSRSNQELRTFWRGVAFLLQSPSEETLDSTETEEKT